MRYGQIPLIILLCLFVFVNDTRGQDKEIDSLKKVLNNMPADSNKVKTLRLLFIATIDKESADKAIPIAQQQLELATKLNYRTGVASAYKLLNVGYQTIGNLEKAIDYSLKSLKIYEQLNDLPGIGSSYSNIGVIYRDENKLDEALNYFKKSLEIYSRFNNKQENIWRAYINIGMTYERQHKDSLALANYQLAHTAAKTIIAQQHLFVATSLYHIANIYFNRQQPALSNKYLTDAVKYLDGGQQAYPASEIYILLSKTYLQEKRLSEALIAAKAGLVIVQKENYKTQLAENYMQLARVYAAMKQYAEAYKYQSLYTGAKDSLVNEATVQKLQKLQYDYELEKKEAQNKVLLKDKKLKAAEISLQKTTIQRQYAVGAFIAVALLSFILMSVFYYRNLQLKKKDNQLLQAQQREIVARNHEIMAQNEEISSQKEHLAQINSTKNKLFSIISHDLRSPVLTLQDALMLVNNQLLTREEFDQLSEELLKNVASTSDMLDNVLYWAKSQMEGIRINKQVFDIKGAVDRQVVNFGRQAANKNIKLFNEIKETAQVCADAAAIDLVLRNLISNAIKFCNSGDSISISAIAINDFMQVSVADTGRGISANIQQKLFNPTDFYSTYGTGNEKGTGLGLNLCREFVELHGGAIWVQSELRKGSVFTFTVPSV